MEIIEKNAARFSIAARRNRRRAAAVGYGRRRLAVGYGRRRLAAALWLAARRSAALWLAARRSAALWLAAIGGGLQRPNKNAAELFGGVSGWRLAAV